MTNVTELCSREHRICTLAAGDVDGGLVRHMVPQAMAGDDDKLVRVDKLDLLLGRSKAIVRNLVASQMQKRRHTSTFGAALTAGKWS